MIISCSVGLYKKTELLVQYQICIKLLQVANCVAKAHPIYPRPHISNIA